VTSRDPDALEQLIDAIAVSGYPLALLRTPSASPTISAVRRRFPLAFVRPAGACPFIELDDAPERALSKRRREDLRRAVRRAERSGGANAVVHEPTTADVDDLLELAYAIEAESWKGRSGTALAHDARRAAFYRRYARTAAAERSLRVAILEVGGEAAAMQIAVEQDDALWLLKIGYSERFAQVSPGQLLMLETLRWAATRGLARYEFLGTGAPWTQAWTRRERACAAVYAYPASGRGVARLAADATTRLGRRLR
jgi:CelD/BcsL family acetyltransferase involved in cellulose biosynthesis